MRHGWSCSNALSDQGKCTFEHYGESMAAYAASRKFFMYSDPSLTDLAINRTAKLGELIRKKIASETGGSTHGEKKLMVFSSVLVRAMETALWSFPGREVRPIPYIAETGTMP